MALRRKGRPPVAIGHVFYQAADVAAASRWFAAVGMRSIWCDDEVAVLELRGGTHLVVTKAARKPRPGKAAPFDLMVDDVDAAQRNFAKQGLKPSRIRRGSIHDEFLLAGPDGMKVTVLSSHAGRRPV